MNHHEPMKTRFDFLYLYKKCGETYPRKYTQMSKCLDQTLKYFSAEFLMVKLTLKRDFAHNRTRPFAQKINDISSLFSLKILKIYQFFQNDPINKC